MNNKIYDIYNVLYKIYGQQGWWPLVHIEGENANKLGNTSGYHVGNYNFPRACKSNCVNISNSYYAERSIYEEKRKA